MGGRFSRNAMDAEEMLRGRLAAEFMRTREQALLGASEVRNQALASLLGASTQAGQVNNQFLASLLGFLQPGAPMYQPGILGELIAAGGTIAGQAVGAGGGGATVTKG
jgi:hypothetical protein